MKRASYREAITWIALNDDTGWLTDDAGRLDDGKPVLSVTAALVADIFGADQDRIVADLNRFLARLERGASRR